MPLKRRKIDNGPVAPVMAPAIDVNWIPGVACMTISEIDRAYWSYHVINGDDAGQPADIPADVENDVDDIFAQEALWEEDGGASFTADDRFVNVTSLTRLSKTITTSESDLSNFIKGIVDESEAPQAATAKD